MILGPNEIAAIASLVSGFDPKYTPKTAAFDVRIGSLHRHMGYSRICRDTRYTGKLEKLEFSDRENEMWTLQNKRIYIAQTIESVKMPADVSGMVIPRSTTYRSGLIIKAGFIDAGYEGPLTIAVFNATANVVWIQHGARLVSIVFMRSGQGEKYSGVWQGGVMTTGKEVFTQ